MSDKSFGLFAHTACRVRNEFLLTGRIAWDYGLKTS
jgi:hypothetical protein